MDAFSFRRLSRRLNPILRLPRLESLILTHIFGKSLDKGIAKAEIISISTMAIVLPGSFTKSICKMWVRIRLEKAGAFALGFSVTWVRVKFCVGAGTWLP